MSRMQQKNGHDALAAFDVGTDHKSTRVGNSLIVHADCLDWLARVPENSIHGIVTDPPYGVKEYDVDQLEKREAGVGGIWRLPPCFDGHKRSPLPRFTALNGKERHAISLFFEEWARQTLRALRPGAHVFIATNTFVSQLLYEALVAGGLEFRGELIRLVMTLRGGDKPKNAEEEFPDVCSLPRGCFEPWGVFRKPIPSGMTVSECLREYQTGALRNQIDGTQFRDVIKSERTPRREKAIANHPSLKPQSLLRQLVYSILPLGTGVIAEPFMGSGSTVAAAEAMGLQCVGVERYADYYDSALGNIENLAALEVGGMPSTAKLF